MFRLAAAAGQIPVNSGGRRDGIAGQHVSGHEREHVSGRILSLTETIYAFDDIQSTEVRATPGNALAFDDRVRLVIVICMADVLKEDGNIGYPFR